MICFGKSYELAVNYSYKSSEVVLWFFCHWTYRVHRKTSAPGCWNLAEFRETGVNGPQVLSISRVSEMRVRLRSEGWLLRKKCFPRSSCLSVGHFGLLERSKERDGEGNGTPLQYSCLENPMDGGAWKAAVHGVTEGQIRLSDFTFTFHLHALEKKMATHSSLLAWRSPGTGHPGGLPSMRSHRVGYDWSDSAAAAASKVL